MFITVFENKFLYALLAFIVFDIITGTLKAFSTNTVNSKINKKGITNHITIFLFCIFFTWVFYFLNVNEYSEIYELSEYLRLDSKRYDSSVGGE